MLHQELQSKDGGSFRVIKVITGTLGSIMSMQSLHVSNECKMSILKRGIEKSTILRRDMYVNGLVSEMLVRPFCDKDGILKLQHELYGNLMNLEVKGLGREMTHLSLLISKQRRALKSICSNEVFKMCNDFLQSRRASEMISFSRENETIWKAAVLDKERQLESIDKWLGLVSNIYRGFQYYDEAMNAQCLKFGGLAVAGTMHVDIEPGGKGILNPTTRSICGLRHQLTGLGRLLILLWTIQKATGTG